MSDFELIGKYRVQSTLTYGPAYLRGDWHPGDASLHSAVQSRLARHPLNVYGRQVRLKTASLGLCRGGVFADCPDVLYKEAFFSPMPGTSGMTENLIDLDKALLRWKRIASGLDEIWGAYSKTIVDAVNDPVAAIRNEYFFHEAGHLIGFDIEEKIATEHFRVGGALRWSLVYGEEVRADLHAMAMAAESLSESDAVAVFLYHVATRFGMRQYFGLVPLILLCVLHEIGLVTVEPDSGRFRIAVEHPRAIVAGMKACGEWIAERITVPEIKARNSVDRAMASAGHVRDCRESGFARTAPFRYLGGSSE